MLARERQRQPALAPCVALAPACAGPAQAPAFCRRRRQRLRRHSWHCLQRRHVRRCRVAARGQAAPAVRAHSRRQRAAAETAHTGHVRASQAAAHQTAAQLAPSRQTQAAMRWGHLGALAVLGLSLCRRCPVACLHRQAKMLDHGPDMYCDTNSADRRKRDHEPTNSTTGDSSMAVRAVVQHTSWGSLHQHT